MKQGMREKSEDRDGRDMFGRMIKVWGRGVKSEGREGTCMDGV